MHLHSPVFSRRSMGQIAGGLGLSLALPSLEGRAAERRGAERAKSLVTIFLGGAISQLESWDPHPGTPIGGETKSLPTTIPGLEISDFYPRVAEQIHHLSVIRSLVSKEGDHERGAAAVKTGYRPEATLVYPALGAIVAHERPNKQLQIPQYISIGPIGFASRAGYLGGEFDPYRVTAPGTSGGNLRSTVSDTRQQRRLDSLAVLSQQFAKGRKQQTQATLHQHTIDAALQMMTSPQLKAFELDEEPQSVRDAYGPTDFGRGCLVARRLLETGVRSIELTLEGWDTHVENHAGQKSQAAILDPALAMFLQELASRDLLQSTIVLVISEFGRTPKINPLDGRDHWPTGFSCLVGGGGLKSGLVIGATDPTGENIQPTDPIEIPNLYATLLRQLDIEFTKELITPIGRPMKLCSGTPLDRLRA